MTFSQAISSVFSKYATFSGRASRSEYWYFVLLNIIITVAIYALGFASGSVRDSVHATAGGYGISCIEQLPAWVSVVTWIYSLAVLLPGLAVSVRRMHDIGKGGGWIFISLIPLVGPIWYLVLLLTGSEPAPNRFGEVPA